jgi:hypothetical protein
MAYKLHMNGEVESDRNWASVLAPKLMKQVVLVYFGLGRNFVVAVLVTKNSQLSSLLHSIDSK